MSQTRPAEPFLHRWSRRKREVAPPDEEPVRGPETSDADPAGQPKADEAAQLQALRTLWRAEPDLCRPDELDDFLEDFTEAARAVPAGLLTTAYAIGRGFWREEEREGTAVDGDATAQAHGVSCSGPVAAEDGSGASGSDGPADRIG